MGRTKIVVTLGPATSSREMIRQLIEAGMDVARLNFSHGTHAEHAERIAILREAMTQAKRSVAILMDLQGPKIRTGPLAEDRPVELRDGQTFTIATKEILGTAQKVSTTYASLPQDVSVGDRLLVSDGLIDLRVQSRTEDEIVCQVIHGDTLKSRQGINLPGVDLSCPAVTEKDFADLAFGLSQDVDYVAISFVRKAQDVQIVKDAIHATGKDTPVIAKLEKPEALDVLPEILNKAYGVMVARGDMGVEMSPEHVPGVQKRIIREANAYSVPVITATQMLDSMISHPHPTRAEVSDVANAILDGSDAVMLSGETAIGAFPIAAVSMMRRIADSIEKTQLSDMDGNRPWNLPAVDTTPKAIGAAVDAIARSLPIRAVCVVTKTGNSARIISHHRPTVPILAFTPMESTHRRMNLFWGVTPVRMPFAPDERAYYAQIQSHLLKDGHATPGDLVVVTGGHPIAQGGPTNFLKILRITE